MFMSSLLSACALSPQRVQVAVFQIQTTWDTHTHTDAYPTYTRYSTATRYPTHYPTCTKVLPTFTPAPSPTPPFTPQTIGPV